MEICARHRYKSRITIAKLELLECRQVYGKARRQRNGKRTVIGDYIAGFMVEIRHRLFTAEKIVARQDETKVRYKLQIKSQKFGEGLGRRRIGWIFVLQ